MKFSDDDFAYEALHQGLLIQYSGYHIKWSSTKDTGFIKFSKPNIPMEDEVRFNIKTGRQITVNSSAATIDRAILDTVFSVLKSMTTKIGGNSISLLDAAVIHINNSHLNELQWELIDNDKFTKFILAPKKKGE